MTMFYNFVAAFLTRAPAAGQDAGFHAAVREGGASPQGRRQEEPGGRAAHAANRPQRKVRRRPLA